MSYYEDAINQLQLITENYGNKEIKEVYQKEIEKVFLGIYIINYLSNRIELEKFFDYQYYKVSFSCLLESFSLILSNHPRGSSLVLRSALENFIKYIIEVSNSLKNIKYPINDRSYSENKKNLECIIKDYYNDDLKQNSISLNSQMETYYKKLSGLSHSLTSESKNNVISYFSDIKILNNDNLKIVFDKFLNIIKQMFGFCIIICEPSLKNWDSYDLNKVLRIVFGKSRTNCFLSMLK